MSSGRLLPQTQRPSEGATRAEVLLAHVRDRKQRLGSRLSVESILGHREADRR